MYIAENKLLVGCHYFAKKVCLQWTLKMLRLSAGSRRLSGSEFQVDSKTLTTKTVETKVRNDQLPLTGWLQMLMTRNIVRWCAAVH